VRVFLDTNVLVSAFASRGLCADLLELVLLEHDLVSGQTVLREFTRNCSSPAILPC
jgi:predicted nucleic acid-binding protein